MLRVLIKFGKGFWSLPWSGTCLLPSLGPIGTSDLTSESTKGRSHPGESQKFYLSKIG